MGRAIKGELWRPEFAVKGSNPFSSTTDRIQKVEEKRVNVQVS